MKQQEVVVEHGNQCDKCGDLRAHGVEVGEVPANLCARCFSFFKGNDEYEKLKQDYRAANMALQKYVKLFIGFR